MNSRRYLAAIMCALMLAISVLPGAAFADELPVEQAIEQAIEQQPSVETQEAKSEQPVEQSVTIPVEIVQPEITKAAEPDQVPEPTVTPETKPSEDVKPQQNPTQAPTKEPVVVPEIVQPEIVVPIIVPEQHAKPAETEQPTELQEILPDAVAKDDMATPPETFIVTFIYFDTNGAWRTEPFVISSGGIALPPDNKAEYYTDANGIHIFKGWDNRLEPITKDVTITATYIDSVIYPMIPSNMKSYSGKPNKEVVLTIPIEDAIVATVFSNKSLNGGKLTPYDSKLTPAEYDQSLAAAGIEWISVSIDTSALSELPFTSASVTNANKKKRAPYIMQQFTDDPAYYTQFGYTKGSINKGWAIFELTVKSGAKNGSYEIPLIIEWKDSHGTHVAAHGEAIMDSATVEITGEKTSSGISGGGGGGGGGTDTGTKAVPTARLYIENVRTEPANPKAGSAFKIILTLVNTSKTLYLQNMLLTYTCEGDVIKPAGENTNVQFITKLNANSKLDVEIPVESTIDVATKNVKLDVSIELEDKRMEDLSHTQSVIIPVEPVQRVKIDEPKLPSGSSYVDQEYEIEVSVANTGKSQLLNLAARIISANPDLEPGSPFYGGPVEPGTSKTITLAPIPIKEGEYDGQIEITYEDDQGNLAEPHLIDLNFYASNEEAYDDGYDNTQYQEPEPVKEIGPIDIMALLPWQLYAAVGALFMLVIISITVSARKRRKKAMEDDEVD